MEEPYSRTFLGDRKEDLILRVFECHILFFRSRGRGSERRGKCERKKQKKMLCKDLFNFHHEDILGSHLHNFQDLKLEIFSIFNLINSFFWVGVGGEDPSHILFVL